MHTLWLATQRGFRNCLWALAWMGAACTQAQSWPERPVKIVVSAAAGTAPDIIARVMGEQLSLAWGKGVVIDNRPGAGGNLGAQAAARSAPDGYTLWFGHATPVVMNQYLFKNPGFDANRDFSEIVAWLRKLGAVAEDTTGNRPIVWPQPIVDYPWPLADRTDQFELFHQIITARCQERILLVDGPSNSGKSVFVTELFNFAKRLNLRSVLLDLKGCLALDELFATLALEVDRTILPAFHSSSGSARKAALLKDLENLPSPLVLGFDTYQEVPPDIADWIEGQLLRRVGQCPGITPGLLLKGSRHN